MIDNVDIAEALYVLRPGAEWCLREGGYSEIVWLDDSDQPTEAEVNAKAQEIIDAKPLAELRKQRNQLLAETDWTANSDVTMSDEMRTYRQALRDLPANISDPANPTWPTKPEATP